MEDFIEAYRPDRFEDVLGNHHIKNQMKMWVSKNFYPKTILLVGECGIGKTTLARLISRRFVCSSATRDSIEACGKCGPCLAELTEFDLANDSVEVVRRYLRKYAINLFTDNPAPYFDETQRWNMKNQEIFLKPIEEMKTIRFIFSTTSLSEIEPGILSRSTILHVSKPSLDELSMKLGKIAKENNIDIAEDVLRKLIKLARCVPRDCHKTFNLFVGIEGKITEDILNRAFIRKSILWKATV